MLFNEDARARKGIPLMLEAGAAVLVEAQKAEAKTLDIEDSGDFIKSIKASKVKNSGVNSTIEVLPMGNNHYGVRNAEVGFVNEYGSTKQAPRAWMTAANEKSKEKVYQAMREAWEGMGDDN